MPFHFDLFAAELVDDPYPAYARLLEEAPVHFIESRNLWVLSGYDDVAAALRDPATFSSPPGYAPLLSGGFGATNPEPIEFGSVDDPGSLRVVVTADPPIHTRLRRLVNRPFTPRAMAANEAWIRERCERLFGELVASTRCAPRPRSSPRSWRRWSATTRPSKRCPVGPRDPCSSTVSRSPPEQWC